MVGLLVANSGVSAFSTLPAHDQDEDSLIIQNLALNRLNRDEVYALEAQAAGGAVCKPFGVCLAPFLIVEKHPFVLSSNPPELSPDRMLPLA